MTAMKPGGHAAHRARVSRVLDLVAGHASSAAGAARTRELEPLGVAHEVAGEHARVEAMRAMVESESRVESRADSRSCSARSAGFAWRAPRGPRWNCARRSRCSSSRRALDALHDKSLDERVTGAVGATAPLCSCATPIPNARSIASSRTTPPFATTRRRCCAATRKELRGAAADLVRMLERLMAKLEANQRVEDVSVTVRNGRYVIPVRREGRGAVGGIVHDTSSSGSTLFIEPPAAVEAGNRMRELEAEELRETERILLEVTDRLRPHREALTTIARRARHARFALRACAVRDRVRLCAGRARCARHGFSHSRWPASVAARARPRDRRAVRPHDGTASERHAARLGPEHRRQDRVAQGARARSRSWRSQEFPRRSGSGSTIALFDDFFADIGDEQSIEASLSTFSAHLRNLTRDRPRRDVAIARAHRRTRAPAPIPSKAPRSAARFSKRSRDAARPRRDDASRSAQGTRARNPGRGECVAAVRRGRARADIQAPERSSGPLIRSQHCPPPRDAGRSPAQCRRARSDG